MKNTHRTLQMTDSLRSVLPIVAAIAILLTAADRPVAAQEADRPVGVSAAQGSASGLRPTLPAKFGWATTVSGLVEPTSFAFLPDGRILIAEKRGVVRVGQGGHLLPGALLDVSGRVNSVYERGLLAVAIDPGFASNGFIGGVVPLYYLEIAAGELRRISFVAGQAAPKLGSALSLPAGRNPHSVAVADLNGDGRRDVVTANWDSGDVSVLLSKLGIGGQ